MAVPLLDLKRQNASLRSDLDAAFARVCDSGHFILGPELDAFEKECASFLGVAHAVAVSSGTDALLLALMALDIGPGDEVLCPGFTFFATAGCVSRTGATPVFCDVCPVCFNLDPLDAEKRITPRTRAMVPVHLFGQCAAMDSIMALARQHDLMVIEDAAQAFGAAQRSQRAGSFGHFGAYSFFPSKNLGGFGDGGLLVTGDDDLAARARILRVHGMEPKYFHPYIGANFRMDALQAALLRAKLPHLPSYAAGRARNAEFYTRVLGEIDGAVLGADPCLACGCGFSNALDGAKLLLPATLPHNDHIWNQYTLRVPAPGARDRLRDYLQQRGIGCDIYYPLPLHKQECFHQLAAGIALPVCERLASECLSIPVFPELTQTELDEVAAAVAAFFA